MTGVSYYLIVLSMSWPELQSGPDSLSYGLDGIPMPIGWQGGIQFLNASTPNLYSTAVSFDEFMKKNDLCCCWTKWVQRLFACEMSCESPENQTVGPLGRHLPECKK